MTDDHRLGNHFTSYYNFRSLAKMAAMLEMIPPVYRPPSEANSFLLQATLGCSHNKCTYCNMYRHKKFRTVPLEQLRQQTRHAVACDPNIKRVFLCDGDAFVLSTKKLVAILEMLNEEIPLLHRVGLYAYAPNIKNKTDEDLKLLRSLKLSIAYIGLESGYDPTLLAIQKGADANEHIELVKRLQAQGFKTSIMCLLGLTAKEQRLEASQATAKVLNLMQPTFASFLTMTPVEGTEIHHQIEKGSFTQASPKQSLEELHEIVSQLELKQSIFMCNHASNYLPLKGVFPRDKDKILATIQEGIDDDLLLKPEFLRGL